jgi:glc operon protein GlcG
MLVRHMLGLPEAQCAIDAFLREAMKDAQPMAIAVTDSYGELIAAQRMDGAPPRVLRHAMRKAFTAGFMHRGTLEFKAQFKDRDSSLDEWGDMRLTTLQGGLPVRYNGEVVGAVGVGGNSIERDTEICQIAIAAIGLEA